jgi:hypothetical protein
MTCKNKLELSFKSLSDLHEDAHTCKEEIPDVSSLWVLVYAQLTFIGWPNLVIQYHKKY